MLIYNSKKEFIGIDESDLNTLGFSSLDQLRAEAADFADLFVKTPGYIHNFKHVSWIDYLECADASQSSKVIIHANSRNFKCLLEVKTVFLISDTQKSYLIYLSNIAELTNNENEEISADLKDKPSPKAIEASADKFEPIETPIDLPLSLDFDNEEEEKEKYEDENLQNNELIEDDFKIDLEEDSAEEVIEDTEIIEDIEIKEQKVQEVTISEEIYDNGYIYDPQIASDELGLPVDLIEEFIEDFVAQAIEFKDELYESFTNDDNDNIKILSHKLKGVAANLRIEDAFEALVIVNTSLKKEEIEKNLNEFYKIITKLSGEKIAVNKVADVEVDVEVNDEIEINFKEDDLDIFEELDTSLEIEEPTVEENEHEDIFLEVQDSEVPQKIDIPELADDDFLKPEIEKTQDIEVDYSLDLETITDEEAISLEEESIEIDDIELLEDNPQFEEEIIYEKSQIANDIGIDQESFEELFSDYIAEAKELTETITQAIEENDAPRYNKAAVQLKGMSDNMRIDHFTQELETLMQTQDLDAAKSANAKVINIITEISK